MLQEVALGQKSLADYTHIAGTELIERIRELAEPLEGKRVLHVSATAFGGGVSEILYTIVPLMRDVGLDAHWHVIFGKEEFFNATKLLHNSLQGAEATLTDEQWELFDEINAINAEGLQGEWDAIIVHDPQPIGLRRGAEQKGRNWIWRCHIDLSEPNPAPIARLQPLIEEYDATVWHLPDYVPAGMDGTRRRDRIIPPAIDPLSPKNMAFSPEDAAFVCEPVRDRRRPAADHPGLPLRPLEGPDGRDRRLPRGHRGGAGGPAGPGRLDGDRRPRGLGVLPEDLRVRRLATPTSRSSTTSTTSARSRSTPSSRSPTSCLQKSIREGFGLTVTEALWKGRPTVAGNVGGIPLQIEDGETGFLVDSPEECAAALPRDPRRPRARQAPRPGRQGARPRAVPLAAPAARLAGAVRRSEGLTGHGGG